MSMMPCSGCRFLVHARNLDVCSALDHPPREHQNPYTGRIEVSYELRPTVREMRAENGPCGPDRTLYKPNWRTRLRRRFGRER
jgi:hypothetical protein